jgi:hypothetical protein
MDPFTQQVQRIENNDKVREIVTAFRLIPIGDNATRDQLEESLNRILTPAAHKIPETQQKITDFSFTEPELSYHDVAEKPKYRPMKHGIHYLDEDNTLYYNSEIEASEWEDENVVATEARDEATAAAENEAAIQRAYNTALARQQAINTRIFAQPPRWVLIKRRALNDTRMEDSLLQYIDKKHTQVDWYSTITTLHKTGTKIGYTLDHYQRVLHRFISYFKPEMNQLGQKMGLDELARLLMTSTMPVNDREMIIHEIKKLTRRKTESLRVPMSNLYSLATTYYNDDPDMESQRNKLLFNGLQHFTTGITKEKLTSLIKYSQLQKIKLNYHDTLETCILSEKTNGEPADDLQFGQSKDTILVFQANITPVDSLLDNDITPIEFTLANPSKKAKKYEDTKKPKKSDERQPHIHAVKTKIETIPNHRERRNSESEASTSSRSHSRQSSPHQSSPDRSRESSAEREKTPPPPEEIPPSSSRRSRSKEILQVAEPKDYLLHLFDHHAILTGAYFTCPGCIAICIFNKETYPAHYTEVHSQSSALIMLFTETATHIRTQQALQLSLFIEVTRRLESFYPSDEQSKESHYVSYLGGYSSNKKALFREVQAEQIKRSPLELMQELENKLSTEYTTPEEKFNIKRPSSPISLNQRKNKDSYSEKAKQKTTFEETETEKETRTDRQPRQQNKIQSTEQQTPQRKRRAEVNSPERPMSISPSPRRSPPRRTPRRSPSSRRRASRTPDRPAATRPTTRRSLSRKASRRSPSRTEYRNPSPRRTRTTDRPEDYHYSYRPSPEYQTPDSSPSARRRANLYTSSSSRNKME